CRVEQELEEHAVGLGQVQGALHGDLGGGPVAERVPGGRLQDERLSQPGPPEHMDGAVENRREHGAGGVRIALGKPQRRGGDADLPAVAILVVQPGQDLPRMLGLAQACQGLQQ
ncbi:MAG: hypothetical protein ACRDN0_23700, partial [Trebonia sp.]